MRADCVRSRSGRHASSKLILNAGRVKYAWCTMFPLGFVASTTLYAGWRSIFDNFLRLGTFAGNLDAALTAILMLCVFVILAASTRAWLRAIRGERVTFTPASDGPDHRHIPGSGCC